MYKTQYMEIPTLKRIKNDNIPMHVLQTQDYFRSIELHFVFIEHTMLQIIKIN